MFKFRKKSIPENQRVALREAATSMEDMANNLLNVYMDKHDTSELSSPIINGTIARFKKGPL